MNAMQKKMDEEAEKFRKVTMRVLIMQLNSISIMDLVAYGGAALGIALQPFKIKKRCSYTDGVFLYHYDFGRIFPAASYARFIFSYCDEWQCGGG